MPDHLASGDIDVTYSNLPEGQDASVDATVALMSEMAKGKFGARSPKIRAAAINIINGIDPITGARIDMPVADKDYFGMLEAIHNYVRDHIRYLKDVVGQETLSYPEETLFNSQAEDCDGKTILEMALLGAIGLRSYPVVIGLEPNHFSHVYLHAEVPPGRHRGAGQTFAADPIMREWPLGKAAPDDRVKAKRVYSHLAGLGNMGRRLNGIGAFVDAPSYFSPLDEAEAAEAPRALASRITDTGSRGEVVNTKRLTEWGDELDDMFNRSATINPMQAAPAYDLYSRGPITNRGEKLLTSYLQQAPISALRTPPKRGPKIVTVAENKAPARKGTVAPTVNELKGLADYLSDIAAPAAAASRRHLVNGKKDILHRTAALAVYTKQRAKKASGRVVNWQQNSGFLFGLGSLEADQRIAAAKAIEQLAHDIAAQAQRIAESCAGDSPARLSVLQNDVGMLEHMGHHLGVLDALAESSPSNHPRVDAQQKIDALVVIGQSPTFREASLLKATPEQEERRARPVIGVLPGGAVVRDQQGNVIYSDDGSDDGLAGFFSKVKKSISNVTKKVIAAPKKAVQSVHQQVKKLDTQVKKEVKGATHNVSAVLHNKNIRNLALGIATGGGSLLTQKTVGALGKKLMKPKSSGGGAASPATQYTDANGQPITQAQYDAQMAAYNASQAAVTAPIATDPSQMDPSLTASSDYPGSTQSFDYGAGDDSLTMPQPGGSALMDPYAMPADDFGPEDMGPAVEAESYDYGADVTGGETGQSTGDTMNVSESGIEPFADEESGMYTGDDMSQGSDESGGDDASEGSSDDMMSAGDDATEGEDDDATASDEGEMSYDEAPSQPQRRKHRRHRGGNRNVATSDSYAADDMDNNEDGGEGEEGDSSESPPVEGLPETVGGIGLGALALVGIGLYLITRKK